MEAKESTFGTESDPFALKTPWLTYMAKASNLYSSGYEMVYAQAVLAVVGAIALQRGGEVANKIARERILDPLGLQS